MYVWRLQEEKQNWKRERRAVGSGDTRDGAIEANTAMKDTEVERGGSIDKGKEKRPRLRLRDWEEGKHYNLKGVE